MAIILVDAVGRRVEFTDGSVFNVLNDDGTRSRITISDLDAAIAEDVPTTVSVSTPISAFVELNQRFVNEQWNGTFIQLVTAPVDGAVSSGSPVTFSKGIGKICFVVNAGADISGTLVVTGDTVDRATGAVTAADTENITIDALTTDNSDTDAEGNTRHAFTGAYLTSKWFQGSISVSTADLDISDMDVFAVSFEQFNDISAFTIQTFDVSTTPNNAAAWFYAYLYTIVPNVTTKKANIVRQISLSVPVGDSIADAPERLRRGNQGISLDGTKDGFWAEIFFGPINQNYWQDTTMKIWCDVPTALT